MDVREKLVGIVCDAMETDGKTKSNFVCPAPSVYVTGLKAKSKSLRNKKL